MRVTMLLAVAAVTTSSNGCLGFVAQQRPPVSVSGSTSGATTGSTLLLVQKVPDFAVLEEDDYDWSDDDDQGDRKRYVPPDFSVIDDEDNDEGQDDDDRMPSPRTKFGPPEITVRTDIQVGGDDDDYYGEKGEDSFDAARRRPRPIRIKKKTQPSMAGTSWMEKNAKFADEAREEEGGGNFSSRGGGSRRSTDGGGGDRYRRSIADTKTFRQDFRKTRVFVQGIPEGVSWQDLKDHFRAAGNVVFASVSVDVNTGISKGHGIVQFETTAMAQHAIDVMADHPLNGSVLFVREDVQESHDPNARLRSNEPRGPTPPTKWKCANEDNAVFMSEEEVSAIRSLLKARDDARRRKKYDVSDRIRDELKDSHGVFIDDRLRMWWTSVDGNKVPQSIHDIKGEGRWKLKPWRQIPTTPENDACVNSDLVEGLLKQRDIARREKDFSTADALLEEARSSPDGDLKLRIHDESRTWRVWTEDRPSFDDNNNNDSPHLERRRGNPSDPEEARRSAARECVEITEEFAPEKVDEIIDVLKRFKGREFQVLKRLKQQYL